MTVESQNYNGVPERVWDADLGGFRPATAEEREQKTRDRTARRHRPARPQLDDDEQQDLQDYLEYVREHLND